MGLKIGNPWADLHCFISDRAQLQLDAKTAFVLIILILLYINCHVDCRNVASAVALKPHNKKSHFICMTNAAHLNGKTMSTCRYLLLVAKRVLKRPVR